MSGVAAWVDGVAVPAAEVAADVARLRAGPAAALLPRDGTADGRQLRRWVTQRLVVRRLLEHECATRGISTASATLAATPSVLPDPALLGAAAADVLATSAAARAVFAAVTAGTRVPEDEVRAHHAANPDRYARPERWVVRQLFDPARPPDLSALAGAPAREVDPATLVPEVRAAGPKGTAVVQSRLGWHALAVEAVLPAGPVPYGEVREEIATRLTDRRRQVAFAGWLDVQAAARIRLAPGFEHPADPRQPDATHRH